MQSAFAALYFLPYYWYIISRGCQNPWHHIFAKWISLIPCSDIMESCPSFFKCSGSPVLGLYLTWKVVKSSEWEVFLYSLDGRYLISRVILELLYLVESFKSPQNHLTWMTLEIRLQRLSHDGSKVEYRAQPAIVRPDCPFLTACMIERREQCLSSASV